MNNLVKLTIALGVTYILLVVVYELAGFTLASNDFLDKVKSHTTQSE